MKYVLRVITGAIAFSTNSLSLAQPMSTSDLMLRSTTEGLERIIDHCSAKSPETRVDLATEYKFFHKKAADAVAIFITNMPAMLNEEESKMANQFVGALGRKQLEAVQSLDPSKYCQWLINSLRTASTESLVAVMQASYDRYNQLAAASRSKRTEKR